MAKLKLVQEVVGLHDSRCGRHKGHSCNCAFAAFFKEGKSCGNSKCLRTNKQCPNCGRINGKDRTSYDKADFD